MTFLVISFLSSMIFNLYNPLKFYAGVVGIWLNADKVTCKRTMQIGAWSVRETGFSLAWAPWTQLVILTCRWQRPFAHNWNTAVWYFSHLWEYSRLGLLMISWRRMISSGTMTLLSFLRSQDCYSLKQEALGLLSLFINVCQITLKSCLANFRVERYLCDTFLP